MKYFSGNINTLKDNQIFVFGSNLKGIHGAGAALTAVRNFGARQGIGVGLQGQSYAIPTKITPWVTMKLTDIIYYINQFIGFTKTHSNLEFFITRIGCGLAGYSDKEISVLFKGCGDFNCHFPIEWKLYLE